MSPNHVQIMEKGFETDNIPNNIRYCHALDINIALKQKNLLIIPTNAHINKISHYNI